jgi:cytochrome c oxidase subunit II
MKTPEQRPMMKTMKSLWHFLKYAGLALSISAVSTSAWAVQDLPGGPAVHQLNLHPSVTKLGVEQQFLHNFMMIICLVIFVAVFGVMFWSIFQHRKSKGAKAANFHESTTVEIVWTLVPFVIIILMALPATKVVVSMKDTTAADLTIKATGYQWKWGYDYITGEGQGVAFLSTLDASHRAMSEAGKPAGDNYLLKVDNPLVVPVDKKIRIITTANDVIHSFGVPSLGIKQDAIPGFVRDTWFKAEKTGDFYGQCYELCGKEHAYMPIHVKVLSGPDYKAWAELKQAELKARADDPNKVWALPDLIARGEKVYGANCAQCHQANGKGAGSIKALDGSAVVLDADRSKQINILLNGIRQMPAWKDTLSDTEIAAVISYTKNNWSNKTGQIVQPAEVAAMRAGKVLPAPAAESASTSTASAPAGPAVEPAAAASAPTSSVASLSATVYFATGARQLDGSAAQELSRVSAYLTAHPQTKVALSGFVDATGAADKNMALAKERAKAVSAALQKAGVAPERIEMRKPEQITTSSGSEAASQAQARRVEIHAIN